MAVLIVAGCRAVVLAIMIICVGICIGANVRTGEATALQSGIRVSDNVS